MKYIDQIQINYLRSLKKIPLKGLQPLNIFSGANDTGKSNILYALKLFFEDGQCNFDLDYNKERRDEVRGTVKSKQTISVSITFNMPKSSVLPKKVKITKVWDRTGKIVNVYNDLKTKIKGTNEKKHRSAVRQLTGFINKLKFIYIPAVRDEFFFSTLLQLLRESVFDAEDRKKKSDLSNVTTYAQKFNSELQTTTLKLNELFRKKSGIESSLSVPASLAELFGSFQIDTKHGNHEIPLKLRGQGVRMQYIPTILDYISDISRNLYIWGFDEPENSCEYSLCSRLADEFKDNYSRKAQIFVVTHSFSLISLDGANVARYRVCRDNLTSKVVKISDSSGARDLELDLGVLKLNADLDAVYVQYRKGVQLANMIMARDNKPTLLFEGPSDATHFKLSYKDLYKQPADDKYNFQEFVSGSNSTCDGAKSLSSFLTQHVDRIPLRSPLFVFFDYDQEGVNQLNGAMKNDYEQLTGITSHTVYKRKGKNVFLTMIVPPPFRSTFVSLDRPDWCFLSTELLYPNTEIPVINRNVAFPESNIWCFSGKKVPFAERIKQRVENGHSIDFSGFTHTWDIIDKIESCCRGNT